jgi:ParB family chromosome partitioning protein
MTTDYTQPEHWHDAAKLFPLLPDDELASLAADIRDNGLQNPLVLLDGKLLDGRNRALACKRTGVAVKTLSWKPNGISPAQWVMSQNLHRRHLSPSQRAVIAVEAEPLFIAEAKQRQKDHGGTAPGRRKNTSVKIDRSEGSARDQAAMSLRVSSGYVAEIKKIAAKDPSLLPEIKAGKLTIPEAQRQLGIKHSTLTMVSSETNEWYTPKKYVDVARQILGEIDLDPASCVVANRVIKAKRYFTLEEDGLKQEWSGRIWLNPPYGDVGLRFASRLIADYEAGKVSQAILLINSHCTDAKWFQPLFNYVLCFSDHRPKFWNAKKDKSSPTHGSVFVYFGKHPDKFAKHMRQFGAVLHRFR